MARILARDEGAALDPPGGDHPLALAEEVGRDAGEDDRQGRGAVGDREAHLAAVAHHRALGDQAAEAEALALGGRVRGELARAAEELDPVAHGVADERGRGGEQHRRGDDELDAPAFPQARSHVLTPRSAWPSWFSAELTSAPNIMVRPVR